MSHLVVAGVQYSAYFDIYTKEEFHTYSPEIKPDRKQKANYKYLYDKVAGIINHA